MYTKQQVEIREGDNLDIQTLNRCLSRLYNNLANTSFVESSGTPATSADNGSLTFTDSLSTVSVNTLAVSPLTLNNYPRFLNSYYHNELSDSISYNNVSFRYLSLMNNMLIVFGKISTNSSGAIINLLKLFEQTPYTVSRILYVNVGGGELNNTTSPAVVINSITNSSISIAATLDFTSPTTAGLDRVLDWFMIVKIG